ncbi:TcaA second domain-containing protein [Halobacillus massiliensis]|uniref:TcaA second domain-containing protein n=1 Tax=Halobacillus massiliensis TaxID=1926286 RepID=UPI0009E202FD|nr:hypothetical protein [Halobacillus massiliensis]
MGGNKQKTKLPADFANSKDWHEASQYYDQYMETRKVHKKRNWKRIVIYIITLSFILCFSLSGWFYLERVSSAEYTAQKFEKAIKEQDVSKLSELLVFPHDSQSFNASQANHMIDYYKKHSGEFVSTVGYLRSSSGIKEERNPDYFIHMNKSGKKWGIFDDYSIELDASRITVQSAAKGVFLYLNDEHIGKLETNGVFAIEGITPGEHVLKGVVNSGEKKYEEIISLNTYQNFDEPLSLKFEELSIVNRKKFLEEDLEEEITEAVHTHSKEYILALESKDIGEFNIMKNESYLERAEKSIVEMKELGQSYEGEIKEIGFDLGSLDFSYDNKRDIYQSNITVSLTFNSGYYLDGDSPDHALRAKNTYYWDYEFTYDENDQHWYITSGTPLTDYQTDNMDVIKF